MMGLVNKRSELVFIYDIKDANPNGDPLDSNKPRIDEETGINIVTDVRFKRTIRDYLHDYKGFNGENGKDIFVREIKYDLESIQDAKMRALDFVYPNENTTDEHKTVIENFMNKKIKKEEFEIIKQNVSENLLNKAIDVRLFGATVPFEIKRSHFSDYDKDITSSITFTGPVQFQMGRSLHSVEIKYIKGTGAFASKAGSQQKTFREEYILPYSLIGFYGIINENAAAITKLTEEDVNLLIEGMWYGTKNLITRSKIGQTPRLLLKINYSEKNYFIGEVKNYIKLISDKRDEEIRDPEDYQLDFTELLTVLREYKDKIESIDYLIDSRLQIISNGEKLDLTTIEKFKEIRL